VIVRRPFASTTDAAIRRLAQAKDALDHQTVVTTSGIRIQRVDEAAGLWRQIDSLDQSRVNLDTFLANGERAEAILRVADVALEEGAQVMSQARALAVYLSNDTFEASDRILQAEEVDRMIESLAQVGNAQYGKRHVFAGTAYDTPAFDGAGNYLGNSDSPTIQVSDTQFIVTGFDGGASIRVAIEALQSFAAALRTGDQSQISDQIEIVGSAFETLVSARQDVGHEQADAERINQLTRSLKITVAEAIDQLVGEDPIEGLTHLADLQSSYQIALQVTASRGSTTLFDYLG